MNIYLQTCQGSSNLVVLMWEINIANEEVAYPVRIDDVYCF